MNKHVLVHGLGNNQPSYQHQVTSPTSGKRGCISIKYHIMQMPLHTEDAPTALTARKTISMAMLTDTAQQIDPIMAMANDTR